MLALLLPPAAAQTAPSAQQVELAHEPPKDEASEASVALHGRFFALAPLLNDPVHERLSTLYPNCLNVIYQDNTPPFVHPRRHCFCPDPVTDEFLCETLPIWL